MSTSTAAAFQALEAHYELSILGWSPVMDSPSELPGAIAIYERMSHLGTSTRVALVYRGGAMVLEPAP